ncbi:MAG: 50S ribosomal protein L25/general stress protein Ctc [Rhodospirillaceae bacterium]|jgi:large subunit ribosomal protein L25
MADAISVSAEMRDRAGKGVARAHRRAGRVPAVIYGNKLDPVSISVEQRELERLINDPRFFNQIFEVQVNDETHQVLARDLQLHPVSDRPLHVDFLRFNENTRIVLEIPVDFLNEEVSPGLKRGGVLNIVRREIELLCSPLNIPEILTADLTGLDIGDSIHISAIELPEGVEVTTDRDFTVATIAAPTVMPTEEEEGEEGEEGEERAEGAEEGKAEDSGDSDGGDSED